MKERFWIGIDMEDLENENFIYKIRYIHSDRNYCEIHLQNGEMRLLRSPLYLLEERLVGKGFFRIHKSYLINWHWIDKITGGKVICGEETLPISVRKMTEFKRWYQRSSQI